MNGYTKLFSSILDSTIWQEDLPTKVLWITMLAMSDYEGVVEGSIPGLARRAGISIEDCERSLAKLYAPDKYSRSPEHEGRRIEAIDGGWLILNRVKYRNKNWEDDKARRRSERNKRYYERLKASDSDGSDVSDASGASELSESDRVRHKKEKEKEKYIKPINPIETKARARRLPEDWIPKESHYRLAKELGVILDIQLPIFRDHFLGNGDTKLDWDKTFNNWLRRSQQFDRRTANGTPRTTISAAQQRADQTKANGIAALKDSFARAGDYFSPELEDFLNQGDSGRVVEGVLGVLSRKTH